MSNGSTNTSLLNFVPREVRFDEDLLAPLNLQIQGENLDIFVDQYTKLQQALLNAHESEQKLVSKCKSLAKQIRSDSQKLTTLFNLHSSDEKKKASLKAEIETGKQQKDDLAKTLHSLRSRVNEAQTTLDHLAQELQVPNSSSRIHSEETAIAELEQQTKQLSDQCNRERQDVTKLRQHNVDLTAQLSAIEETNRKSQVEVDNLDIKIKSVIAQADDEASRRNDTEVQISELKNHKTELEKSNESKEVMLAVLQKEKRTVFKRFDACHTTLESQKTEQTRLREAIVVTEKVLVSVNDDYKRHQELHQLAQDELNMVKLQYSKLKATNEAQLKQLQDMTQLASSFTSQAEEADYQRSELIKGLTLIKEEAEGTEGKRAVLKTMERERDDYVRAREVLSQSYSSSSDKVAINEAAIRVAKGTLQNTQNELQGYLNSIRVLTRISESLERDKSGLNEQLIQSKMDKLKADKEVADRQMKIAQLQQQITEAESKLRKQQMIVERSITERNHYQKRVIEKRAEMKLSQSKAVRLSALVKRLQDGVREKQEQLLFQHIRAKEVKKDIATIENRNQDIDQSISNKKTSAQSQETRVRNMCQVMTSADNELRTQMKQYNSIVHEHSILAQQLIKRNNEIAELYQHLRLQNSVIEKANGYYENKGQVLKSFHRQKDELIQALEELQTDNSKFLDLQAAIVDLQQAVVDEKLKVQALTTELQKPMNIHRWRKLKATNIDVYQMIKQIRKMQKLIVNKGDQVSKYDNVIQDKEKLYVELRRVLARQPGSEAAEQLRLYASTLRDKKEKHQAMVKELRVFQDRVYEYKNDLSQLQQELGVVKQEFFSQKKKELYHNNNNDDNNNGVYSAPDQFAHLYNMTSVEPTPYSDMYTSDIPDHTSITYSNDVNYNNNNNSNNNELET